MFMQLCNFNQGVGGVVRRTDGSIETRTAVVTSYKNVALDFCFVVDGIVHFCGRIDNSSKGSHLSTSGASRFF